MAVNVEVTKNNNENNTNIIRRFTRRVQEAGILGRVRSIRYYDRVKSSYVRKKKRLKSLIRKADVDKQIKLGKLTDSRQSHR